MSNEFEESYSEPAAPETPRRPARRERPKPRRDLTLPLPWLIAGAAVIAAAAVGIYFGAIRSSSPATLVKGGSTPPALQGHYRLVYPKDWKTISPNTVAPGQNAFAAVSQTKGHGVVVFKVGGKVANLTGGYLRGLESQLKRKVASYKFVGAHVITLKAGKALDLTYDVTSQHQVRNVVVLQLSKGTIVMATVAGQGDAKTTREIDDIVSSFEITS